MWHCCLFVYASFNDYLLKLHMCKKKHKLPNLGIIIIIRLCVNRSAPGPGGGSGLSFSAAMAWTSQGHGQWMLLKCLECFSTWLVDAWIEKLIHGSRMQLTRGAALHPSTGHMPDGQGFPRLVTAHTSPRHTCFTLFFFFF